MRMRSHERERYTAVVDVGVGLPLYAEADELTRVCMITREEAARANVVGVPVTVNFGRDRIGTVVASEFVPEEGRWTLRLALRVESASFMQWLVCHLPYVAPSIKIVRGSPQAVVKSIDSFSFVRRSVLPGARSASIRPEHATFSALQV